MSCNPHKDCAIEALPIITDIVGVPLFVISVWSVDRVYGGPEEGGWWYDTGTLEHLEFFTVKQIAELRLRELREKYPNTGKSGSVLGGEDYNVELHHDGKIPHPYYPLEVPHYE